MGRVETLQWGFGQARSQAGHYSIMVKRLKVGESLTRDESLLLRLPPRRSSEKRGVGSYTM